MIENPWHSRPIDVHRWSDHPEAMRLANELWVEYFPELVDDEARSGPKPKTSFRNQFKMLILDLWVAWNEDPTLSVGVPLSSNAWTTTSRYNALHISKKIIPLIDRLRDEGLVDFAHGSYSGPNIPSNRNSRILASARLIAYFERSSLSIRDVSHHPDQECIILKAQDDPNRQRHWPSYATTSRSLASM